MLVTVVKMTFQADAVESFKEFFEERKDKIKSFEHCTILSFAKMIYMLISFLLIVIVPMKLHWYIIVIQLFLEIPGNKQNNCLRQRPRHGL